ncbi:MAG TPA: SMR family transporter [Thermodesulfobacteriota bacterium]|nr:SMR family transporter [Thermodesulfobacteriota bacterium]
MNMYMILALAIFLNALANILMKVGMMRQGASGGSPLLMAKAALVNPVLFAGVVSFALALVAYSYVLSKINLSIAYPVMTSLGYVIVIIASWMFLKEHITFVQVIGFAFIISGVWMVAQ